MSEYIPPFVQPRRDLAAAAVLALCVSGVATVDAFKHKSDTWNFAANCPLGAQLSVDANGGKPMYDDGTVISLLCTDGESLSYPTQLRRLTKKQAAHDIASTALSRTTSVVAIRYTASDGFFNDGRQARATYGVLPSGEPSAQPCIQISGDDGLSPIQDFKIQNITITQQ